MRKISMRLFLSDHDFKSSMLLDLHKINVLQAYLHDDLQT